MSRYVYSSEIENRRQRLFGNFGQVEKQHVKMQEVFSISSYAEALSITSLSIRICLNTWMEGLKVKHASFERRNSVMKLWAMFFCDLLSR